jgi:hypothetical protein
LIAGVTFRAGAKISYFHEPPFDPMEIELSVEQEVAGLSLPAGTRVLLDGTPLTFIASCTTVAHRELPANTRIPWRDGAWHLDEAEPLD